MLLVWLCDPAHLEAFWENAHSSPLSILSTWFSYTMILLCTQEHQTQV